MRVRQYSTMHMGAQYVLWCHTTSMSSVATVMLVDMVAEAGGLELAVLAGRTVLGVLLGGVARLGWCRMSTGYRAPLPLESIQRPSEFHPGYPYRGTRIGRILLEGLLQIVLEHSVGAIILARVMEVVVSAYEVIKCRKRIALPESLKDGGKLPTRRGLARVP